MARRKGKPLTVEQVLARADAHFVRTGEWPRQYSRPVTGASGETWVSLNRALALGNRELPGNEPGAGHGSG